MKIVITEVSSAQEAVIAMGLTQLACEMGVCQAGGDGTGRAINLRLVAARPEAAPEIPEVSDIPAVETKRKRAKRKDASPAKPERSAFTLPKAAKPRRPSKNHGNFQERPRRNLPATADAEPQELSQRDAVRLAMAQGAANMDVLTVRVQGIRKDISRAQITTILSQLSAGGEVDLDENGVWHPDEKLKVVKQ